MSLATMSDTPPRVPAELTDVVVDFLHDDKKSLGNCALVSKEWLSVARYHLFREIYIHESNVNEFKKLITSRSTTVMPHHIHSVVIDEIRSRHTKLFDMMYIGFRPFDSVHTLELRSIDWRFFTADSINRLVSAFQMVTDLRFDTPNFIHPKDLWSLVARFPLLQRLSVANPSFTHKLSIWAPGPNFNTVPYPKIHDLLLSETSDHPTNILEWLSFHGALLDSLSVHVGRPALPGLNRYLKVLGPSLLFFTMEIWFDLEETSLSQLDLSFNTRLRKLCFPNFHMRSRHALASTIPAMLARIASSDLDEIEFVRIPEQGKFLQELADDAIFATPSTSMWSALDNVLSGFSGLRTVRFILHQSDPVSFVGYVRRGLSLCNARNLLSFEHVIDGRVQPL